MRVHRPLRLLSGSREGVRVDNLLPRFCFSAFSSVIHPSSVLTFDSENEQFLKIVTPEVDGGWGDKLVYSTCHRKFLPFYPYYLTFSLSILFIFS